MRPLASLPPIRRRSPICRRSASPGSCCRSPSRSNWAVGFSSCAATTPALLLAGFCVATAVLFHTKFGDRNQLLHFEKDFAIAGGLLVLFAHGGGAWALDALRMPRIRRKEPQARAARVLLMSLVPMSDSRRLRAISRKFGHAADRTFRPPARLIF